MRPTVVLLDAGNTIIEIEYDKVADLFAECGAEVAADDVRDHLIRLRPALNDFVAGEGPGTENSDTLSYMLGLLCDGLGVSDFMVRLRLGRALAAVMTSLWRAPVEDCAETLGRLREAGYRLGIVSNSDGALERSFEEIGLSRYFETIVDSGAVGVEKPDPEIFRIALRRLGVPPEEALYVGDLPAVDVVGAQAAGIAPVLIDPAELFPDVGVPRITAFLELPALLATFG